MKTIVENNRMIAEFMSVNTNPNGTFELPQFGVLTFSLYFKTEFNDEQLRYHTSWEWLMPVVEKIEWGLNNGENFWIKVSKIDGENSYIPHVYYGGYDNGKPFDIILHKYFDSKLAATYQAVVSFIEWYNEQK